MNENNNNGKGENTLKDRIASELGRNDISVLEILKKNTQKPILLYPVVGLLLTIIGFLIKGYISEISNKISINTKSITEIRDKISDLEKSDIQLRNSIINSGDALTSLSGKTYFGNVALFTEKTKNEEFLFCSLNSSYPWNVERNVLKKYLGKDIYITIDGYLDNSHKFKVTGFFSSNDDSGNMVKISQSCLLKILDGEKATELISNSGSFCKIFFPFEE